MFLCSGLSRGRRAFVTFLVAGTALVHLAGRDAWTGEEARPRAKKLIEFGWDEPDTEFLREHIAEMEKSPFDGCVFHVAATSPVGLKENFSWLCWGRRGFSEEEFKPALDDLKATPFQRFTHNFLRFNTAPGDLDWFDDHTAVLDNATIAARIAHQGKCAGILFDVEEYEGKLFTYAKQRHAKTKSWEEYSAQVRRRGNEVMTRFQEEFPDITVILTFGFSWPRTISEREKKPLSECRSGLLAPFLDGMLDAANGRSQLVDGFELSYSYREKAQFDRAYKLMKEGVLPIVADRAQYKRVVSSGFGLWMDNDWREKGWDEQDPSKNYFSPEGFGKSLTQAIKRSDEYVWIYTETPRWWSPQGGSVKLPAAYDDAIRRARRDATRD